GQRVGDGRTGDRPCSHLPRRRRRLAMAPSVEVTTHGAPFGKAPALGRSAPDPPAEDLARAVPHAARPVPLGLMFTALMSAPAPPAVERPHVASPVGRSARATTARRSGGSGRSCTRPRGSRAASAGAGTRRSASCERGPDHPVVAVVAGLRVPLPAAGDEPQLGPGGRA